jgi:signal transduction histidine kinase
MQVAAEQLAERGGAANGPTRRALRALVVEDCEEDFLLLQHHLMSAGFNLRAERVEDERNMRRALAADQWDIVLADHHLPRFSARHALVTLQAHGADLPFIILSGAIGEDAAVEAMLAGADDYVMKSRMARLVPAIERSIAAAEARRERRDAEAQLLASREELRALSAHLEQAKEAERSRIAREIHDDIGSTLTGLKADLAWLKKRFGADTIVMEKLAGMAELLDGTMQASVRIARDLRPPVLDFGFVPAIQWQAEDFQRRTGVRCRVTCDDEDLDVPSDRATAAFRVFQELLTNVAKHSGAREVSVAVHATAGMLQLEVMDDGRGVADAEVRKRDSYGIRGMIERARELGGEFEIAGMPTSGTHARLRLPLAGGRGVRA